MKMSLGLKKEKNGQGPPGAPVQFLKRISERHRMIARLLADGKRPGEIVALTGYSNSRISILQNDPAFMELVATYREQAQAQYLGIHQKLAGVASDALDVLADRLEAEGDTMPVSDVLNIATMTLDRSGFGKESTIKVDEVSISVKEIRQRVQNEAQENIRRLPIGGGAEVSHLEGNPTGDENPLGLRVSREGEDLREQGGALVTEGVPTPIQEGEVS